MAKAKKKAKKKAAKKKQALTRRPLAAAESYSSTVPAALAGTVVSGGRQ